MMTKESNTVLVNDEQWLEDIDADLPEAVAESKAHGRLPAKFERARVRLGVRQLPDGREMKFTAALTDTLREVFERGAETLGKPLLPPGSPRPLDTLHCRERGGQGWGEPLEELGRPLWLALAQGCTRHLGINYVLAVKINTKWGVAPSANATPRELLTSFGFDPAEFSLYRADGAAPLPPDAPLTLERGDTFEAQKDGRYGAPAGTVRPVRGTQTVEDDVEAAREAGINVRLFAEGGQRYVEVRDLPVPSPPWSRDRANILVAIPATYPVGGLDAFYLELTITHANGSVPYQSSTAQVDGRAWGLISWHYAINRPWSPRHDDLLSHIEHCRGYFLRRGVRP